MRICDGHRKNAWKCYTNHESPTQLHTTQPFSFDFLTYDYNFVMNFKMHYPERNSDAISSPNHRTTTLSKHESPHQVTFSIASNSSWIQIIPLLRVPHSRTLHKGIRYFIQYIQTNGVSQYVHTSSKYN